MIKYLAQGTEWISSEIVGKRFAFRDYIISEMGGNENGA